MHFPYRILWVREDQALSHNASAGFIIETNYTPDNTVMTTTLLLTHLVMDDTGIWKCMVSTPR